MGSLAEQDINGVMRMVLLRSRWLGRALAAITAGTVQPNPRSMGRNAFPDSPTMLMVSFITYATLAI